MHTVNIKYGDECFKSLLKLYESGYGRGIYTVENNTIRFNDCIFVMQDDEDLISKEKNGGYYPMEEDGAPAFANFRRSGGEIETDMAKWKELITEVSKSFHKTNTWLRYDTTSAEASPGVIEADKKRIKVLLETIWYSQSRAIDIEYKADPNEKDAITTIYGASLRLGICVEMPKEEIPIVGRIYFKRELDNSLVPLSYEVAETISEKLKIFEKTDKENQKSRGNDEDGYSFNDLETALRRGIKTCLDSTSGNGLADYLLVKSDNSQDGISIDDNKIIEDLIENAEDEVREIVCKNMKILYLFQVRTRNRVYEIKYNNQSILSVMIDMNEELSIRCLTCNEPKLIVERNAVALEGKDQEGKDTVESLTIDDKKEYLGLSSEDFNRVLSKLNEHVIMINCKETSDCIRIKCKNDIVNGSQIGGASDKNYCRDCNKCESIYYVDGKPWCTENLVYDFEKKELILPKASQVCKVCGRSYFTSSLVDEVCAFCRGDEDNEEEVQKSKRLYKAYSDALTPFTRLKHLFSDKRCYEDEEVIVFKLGNDYYTINKLQVIGSNKRFQPTASFKHRAIAKTND